MAKRKRKLTAKQLRFFGTKAQRAKLKRPSKVVIVSTNPKRGIMAKKKRKHHHRVTHRRFRRNPIGGMGGFLSETLAPAAIGAGGAIATDWLANNVVPSILPASMQSPTMQPLTKIALSLGVGAAVSMVAGSRAGGEAAAGGIILALYNFANQQMIGLSYGGAYNPAYMNRYMHGGGGVGFIRRNREINRQRALRGLAPIAPFGVHPKVAPGLSGPYSQTKYRIMRNGGASGRALGFISPAPQVTMGRYMNGRNG